MYLRSIEDTEDTGADAGSERMNPRSFFVSREISEKWGIFKGLQYDINATVDIHIDAATLFLVFEYYNQVDVDKHITIPKPLPYSASLVIDFENALGPLCRQHARWIDHVSKMHNNRLQLWKLLEAANFLHAQKLLDLCCARIAFEFKCIQTNKVREQLGIVNDLDFQLGDVE